MQQHDTLTVAQHLEAMGVDIVRGGFASWVREGLGFRASDEHVDRALASVQAAVAAGRVSSLHDLAHTIATAIPTASSNGMHIDAFGGSAWAMD